MWRCQLPSGSNEARARLNSCMTSAGFSISARLLKHCFTSAGCGSWSIISRNRSGSALRKISNALLQRNKTGDEFTCQTS